MTTGSTGVRVKQRPLPVPEYESVAPANRLKAQSAPSQASNLDLFS